MMDINISKKWRKILIVPHVKFWWMDEKWCQHDIIIIVIKEFCIEVEKELLWQSCNWAIMSCTIYMVSCNSCNSKIELQIQLQNTPFSHILCCPSIGHFFTWSCKESPYCGLFVIEFGVVLFVSSLHVEVL
jgi:hypothetical protein